MKRTYDIVEPNPHRTPKPWWQTVGLDDLRSRVRDLELNEKRGLRHEMDAVVSSIQRVTENPTATTDHRERARFALHRVIERRKLLDSAIAISKPQLTPDQQNARATVNRGREEAKQEAKQESRRRRDALVAEARGALANGELAKALSIALDVLDHKHFVEPEPRGR